MAVVAGGEPNGACGSGDKPEPRRALETFLPCRSLTRLTYHALRSGNRACAGAPTRWMMRPGQRVITRTAICTGARTAADGTDRAVDEDDMGEVCPRSASRTT